MQNQLDTLVSSHVDKAQHTEGPWRLISHGVTTYPEVWADINARHSVRIAACTNDSLPDAEKLANAALIASAPDLKAENIRLKAINEELLAALETCFVDPLGNTLFNVPMVQAAITKARGNHE